MTNILDFLPNYPSIDEPDFFQKIFQKEEFNTHILSKEYGETDQEFLDHQIFISKLLSSYTLYDSLLLFHEMGTGKGGVAFATSERILSENNGINKIFVLTNSENVLSNLKNELIFKFSQGKYIPDDYQYMPQRQKTTSKNKILQLNNYFFIKFYDISYEISNSTDEQLIDKFNNSFFIIDEIHNIKEKNRGETDIDKYNEMKKLLHLLPNKKVLLMTGTPMTDKASEIASILNLILPKNKRFKSDGRLSIAQSFDKKYFKNNKLQLNVDDFTNKIKGIISYLKSTQQINKKYIGQLHPKLKYFITYNLELEGIQAEKYKESYILDKNSTLEIDEEDKVGLYNNSRQSISAVYPDGSYGTNSNSNSLSGFDKYIDLDSVNSGTHDVYKFKTQYYNDFGNLENLKQLSRKYYEIIKSISENDNMCHFVYCKLVNGSGIVLLTLLLEKYLGYKRYTPSLSSKGLSTEDNRYILLSSDTSVEMKSKLIKEFNQEKNKNGKFIRIIFGTFVIKEGLSFYHMQKVHIITPHWNFSETEQIIARAIRYDSHKFLPKDTLIEIMLYVCTSRNSESIDVIMYEKAEEKDVKIKSVEKILKENAIDCQLFKERNDRSNDIDYSRNCEYDICEYKCADIDLTNIDIDKVTQNIYYRTNELISIIQQLYKKYFYILLPSFLSFFNKNTLFEILMSLNYIIDNQIIIKNKYGIDSYLKHDNDIFYLSHTTESINHMDYYYNENSFNNLSIDYLSNKVIFSKLSSITVGDDEKYLYLNYLNDDIIFDILLQSILILDRGIQQTHLCKYFLDVFENKYDRFSISGKTIYVCTYRDKYCLEDGEWQPCNESILKMYDDLEKSIINKTKSLDLTHYGLVRQDNKYEPEKFLLKEIPDVEVTINNLETLRELCKTKSKFECITNLGKINNLVCTPKNVKPDSITLKNKENKIVFTDNFTNVVVNNTETLLISLTIQVDTRKKKTGKECINFKSNELRQIVGNRIPSENLSIKGLCDVIQQYYMTNGLVLYEKYSKNKI